MLSKCIALEHGFILKECGNHSQCCTPQGFSPGASFQSQVFSSTHNWNKFALTGKKTHGLHLTVMRPHCDIMLTEVPLNSHHELSTRPTRSFQDASAFSPAAATSLGPSYTSRVPCFHRVRAQSSLRSCKASTPCNQSYAKNSGIA